MKETKIDKVFRYMQKYRTITPIEAYKFCGTMRLSAVIYELKKQGIKIKTEMVRVTTRDGWTYVAQYSFEEK